MNGQPARPTPSQKPPLPMSVLVDRALVGALAALVVARVMAPGDDPGRLRLTSGTGGVSFNLWVFVLLFAAVLWRAISGGGRPVRWAVVPLLFAGVGVTAFVSSQFGDRYARPGLFVAWEWGAIAAAAFLTRFLVPSVADSRGILNVFVATAACVFGMALYQALGGQVGLPSLEVAAPSDSATLVGDDEFYPALNRSPAELDGARGSFDSTETLLAFMFLVVPTALIVAGIRRRADWGRWSLVIPVLLTAGGVAALFKDSTSPPGGWPAAMELIGRHPVLGVGPGNFSRFAAGALAPHSAWLGLAATTGLVGVGLFIAAVVVAYRSALRRPPAEPVEVTSARTRWEFYLGGVAGLLLGFVWTVGEAPAEAPAREVFKLGGAAVLRAVIWFAAFAWLETIRPAARALAWSAVSGVGLVLLWGLISDAPGRPTILFPMAVLLALAVNFRRPADADGPAGPWQRPVLFTGAIAAGCLAVAYLATAAVPAWATASSVRQARMASRHYTNLHRETDLAPPGAARHAALVTARNYLVNHIVNPLTDAAHRDPTNAALLLEVARWRRSLWQYDLVLDPANAIDVARDIREAGETADRLDPRNLAGKRSLFEAMLLFRRHSKTKEPERLAALNKLIGQIAEREPASEVPLRYRLVTMLLDRRDAEGVEAELTTLLRLNRAEGSPHGSITDEQKRDLIQRAIRVARGLNPEWTQ